MRMYGELMTPTILPEIDEKFNETINAFMDGMNRNEIFHLLDVETAPLLVKRRGMKRRSDSLTKKRSFSGNNGMNCTPNKVPTKLMAVPEDHNESVPTRRPTTLDIEMTLQESPDFTNIRNTKPDDLKFSRDVHASTSK